MKKRIFSIVLALVMVLGMLPMQAFAAEVSISDNTIDITDMSVAAVIIDTVEIQGATVVSAEETDTGALNVVLDSGTDPSAAITATFNWESQAQGFELGDDRFTCTLSGGEATLEAELVALQQGQPRAKKMYELHYTTLQGKLYDVSIPDGTGYTVNGKNKVVEGGNYEFTVELAEGYKADPETGMQVTVNGVTVEPVNGNYVVENVAENLVIAVTGVIAKESCNVTLTAGEGYTLSGNKTAYKGENYNFTVSVEDSYDAANMKVKVNGEVLGTAAGSYTIESLTEDITITVDGLAAKAVCTVTAPSGDGFSFSGNTSVYSGEEYSFRITVDTGYDAADMNVTVNGTEIAPVSNSGAVYTYQIESVSEDVVIAVTGVKAKEVITITLPKVDGLSITGDGQVYAGEDYTFTVKAKSGYTAKNIVVTVNGVAVTGKNNSFTIENVTASPEIKVTATVGKEAEALKINHKRNNIGTLESVTITDSSGNPIEGMEAEWEKKNNGGTITITLPSNFPEKGKIKLTFNVKKDKSGSDYPYVGTKRSTKPTASGINKKTITTAAEGKKCSEVVYFIYKSDTADTIKIEVTITKNAAPELAVSETSALAEILPGENYTLNVASLFSDANDNPLTYQYKIGDGDWTECDASFAYGADLASGDYTLLFRAYDGKAYSSEEGSYTVYLSVNGSDAPAVPTYEVRVKATSGVSFFASNEEGTKGKAIEATEAGGVYTLAVPQDVTHILWRDGDMGMGAAVPESKELTLVKTTFKVMAGENPDNGAAVAVKYGDMVAAGTDNTFLLLQTDGGYTYTVTPGEDVTGYVVTEQADWEPVDGEVTVELDPEHFKVIAPAGSVVSAGGMSSYKYSWATPIDSETVEDTVVYKFAPMGANENPFIRVQRPDDPDAVTYWDYKSTKKSGDVITVTEEMLHMNDSETSNFNSNTVYRNFEHYKYDLADIYMNINAQGYINLNVGGSKNLNMFRTWQSVESISNNKVALPDFEYEIINIEGNNVISIEPDANNSAVAKLTAVGAGTAIVLVTYDAMYREMGLTSELGTMDPSGNNGTGGPFRFSAIWPDRTGVFVVSVGKDGTGIQTNMTLNEREFDAELTPLFYTGSAGAEYSFKPEDGCTVTVNRSSVGAETLHFGGFTAEGISVAQDGTVTVSGLTSGRHIIRLEKNGVYTYQVVTATRVYVTVKDEQGNTVNEENKVKPGETAVITITGITNPVEKLATAYNFSPYIVYEAEDGTKLSTSGMDGMGSYDFSSTAQVIKVKIPNEWNKNTFLMDEGGIRLNGGAGAATISKLGDHRNYEYGKIYNAGGAVTMPDKLGRLPAITIPVDDPIPTESVVLDKTGVTLTAGEVLNLKATVAPENTTDALYWYSSDETLAVVNDGVVNILGEGEVTITAKSGERTADCKIVVKPASGGVTIKPDNTSGGNIGTNHRMLADITLLGVQGSLTESSDSGNTGKTYTVELNADTDKSKAITVRMHAVTDKLTNAKQKETYFWINTPGSTQKTACSIYESKEGFAAVVPEWSDENTAVLYVGLGTADGIVTDSKQTPVYTINLVIADKNVAVTGVELKQTSASINIGETVRLEATIAPEDATNKGFVWTSSEPSVAEVNENGVVTGKTIGTTAITVTTADGGFTDTCNVTVSYVPVDGITLNKSKEELNPGDWFRLLATVSPENATEPDVAWESSADNVAIVDENGKVTAVAEGSAVITAKAGEKTAQCKITVVENVDTDGKATVYLSITEDAKFVKTDKGVVTALVELDVPWFDLSLYGLGDYNIEEGKDGYKKPTMLHLFLYATEVLQYGKTADEAGKGYLKTANVLGTEMFKVSGSPGSISMDMFWGLNSNFLYYHNYVFPADENGYGFTADRVALEDGDIVTRANFASGTFHTDSNSAFSFIEANGETVSVSALQNKRLSLTVYQTGKDLLRDGVTKISAIEDPMDIYYAKADALTGGEVTEWTLLGTTDAGGKLMADISALTPGRYVLAVNGRKGAENPNDVVSAPGGILLTVLEDTEGKQVQDVIDLIDAIGEVTLGSETVIAAARNAYDALSEEQQVAVTNIAKLTEAEAVFAELKQIKENRDAADAVIAKIDAIGTVTVNSGAAIEAARSSYDALTDAQKKIISGETLKKLTDAEKLYAQLTADEADKNAAKDVEEKIAAIGTVDLDSEQRIITARQAYNALTEIRKMLVGNYEVLSDAEQKLVELKDAAATDAAEAKIAAIGTVTLDSAEKIKAARAAYEALTAAQKAMVENLSVLEAAEETLELLELAGTDIAVVYSSTGDYLETLSAPSVGSQNGEWRVLGLARSGRQVSDSYYQSVVKYVTDNIGENGRLKDKPATESARLIVALTAIGKDVTDVGGYDLLAGLNNMEYIGNQGVNGTIWTLIAFDTHDYEIPAGDVTREKLVNEILDKQLADGGWALGGTVSDPDITGMALQALAPYYAADNDVKNAADEAVEWLSEVQNGDGTFRGSDGVTSETQAQIITGLTALDVNPETDSRFVKNGVSAVDALAKFYVDGGGFKHGLIGELNMMATEQSYYALVSYFRLLQGKTALYDMSDVNIVLNVYKIIEGANSDWQKGGAALTIRADGTFDKFTGVKVDGAVIGSKHYTAKAGSTIVTFAAEYLNTLSEGEHTITIAFTDGEATTSLSVMPSDEDAAKRVIDLIAAIGDVTEESGDKIKAAREAYDKLTQQQKQLVTNLKSLTDAEAKYETVASMISVSFTLLGCYKHDSDEVHTLSGGNLSAWVGKRFYKVEAGSTVKDVLNKVLAEAGMTCSNPTGNYVESIDGIGEFTNGSYSGWMYTLNGTHPNLGVAQQTVKDGDAIVFHYTDDYTKEEGGLGFGEDTRIKNVEKLIDAIGNVTLNSGDKINAARQAFNSLTQAQKSDVSNYKKLTDAETAYKALKDEDNKKKADAVEELIDKLDANSFTFEEDVKAAKAAYDKLSAEQKKLVDNYAKLTAALKVLADEESREAAEKVEKLIRDIGTVTKDSEEKIKAAREAYEKLSDEQKALVENLSALEAAEEKLEDIKALADVEEVYKATGDYLEELGTPAPGSIGGEWMVIGLLRSGRDVKDIEAYYESAVKFVQENADENERLHRAKSTENSRMILALTAMGADVSDVGGHDLLKGLGSMEFVCKQGINGPIWALIALDSGNYPVPEGDVSREGLIREILDAQLSDGGWALSGGAADADMTGMALQALAPYYDSSEEVAKAVDRAVFTLSIMQNSDGSYGSIDGESSESIAQVIAGLSALGIDPHMDARFAKNGITVLDALCAFFVEGGGFKHTPEGGLDGMATEQSYYALTAYFRMLDGKSALFDMTDVVDMGGDPIAEEEETLPAEPETTPAPVADEEVTEDEGRSFPWWLVIVIVVLAGAVIVLAFAAKPKKRGR